MGILHGLTAIDKPFIWKETHQRAFKQVKIAVERFRNHHRTPLRYGPNELNINLVTDASRTGISGVISQGNDWKNVSVSAFFSAKLNAAQQNYSVHEQEMFAGVETMRWYRDLLLRSHFFLVHRP